MSVKIRLTKTGKKNQIQFRIVVQDSRVKRDGKFLEILGNFDPKSKKQTVDKNRIEFWIKQGAKPTPSVSYLLENGMLPRRIKKVRMDEKSQQQKGPKVSTAVQKDQTPQNPEELKTDKPQEEGETKIEPESSTTNTNTEEKQSSPADIS